MLRFDYVHSTYLRAQFPPECFGEPTPVKSDL
jgi:hypothetical protein